MSTSESRPPLPPPLEGITAWRNAKNGFFVARVHFTADPAKRGPEWKRRSQAGMPERGWKREFDISFETPEGEPVFPFDRGRMVRDLPVLAGARLCRFWDFGFVAPVVLFAQVDVHGRLRILRELVLAHAGLLTLIEAARAAVVDLLGGPAECFDAGDPAGDAMTDLGQVRAELARAGILLKSVRNRERSYDQLRARLMRQVEVPGEGLSPAFLIRPSCPILIAALEGGFHLSPKTGKPVDTHPVKDVCDALRYGNDALEGVQDDHFQRMHEIAAIDRAW